MRVDFPYAPVRLAIDPFGNRFGLGRVGLGVRGVGHVRGLGDCCASDQQADGSCSDGSSYTGAMQATSACGGGSSSGPFATAPDNGNIPGCAAYDANSDCLSCNSGYTLDAGGCTPAGQATCWTYGSDGSCLSYTPDGGKTVTGCGTQVTGPCAPMAGWAAANNPSGGGGSSSSSSSSATCWTYGSNGSCLSYTPDGGKTVTGCGTQVTGPCAPMAGSAAANNPSGGGGSSSSSSSSAANPVQSIVAGITTALKPSILASATTPAACTSLGGTWAGTPPQCVAGGNLVLGGTVISPTMLILGGLALFLLMKGK